MLSKNLNSHHAIVVKKGRESALSFFRQILEDGGYVLAQNPDILFLDFPHLRIDDAREVVRHALVAPVREETRHIVITFDNITLEAQNALLKVLEDPSPQVRFLLGTLSFDGLLTTLKSRVLLLEDDVPTDDPMTKEAKKFVTLSIKERLAVVDMLIKEHKELDSRERIKVFLKSLYSLVPDDKMAMKRQIADALLYINDTGASLKILLEAVAVL